MMAGISTEPYASSSKQEKHKELSEIIASIRDFSSLVEAIFFHLNILEEGGKSRGVVQKLFL